MMVNQIFTFVYQLIDTLHFISAAIVVPVTLEKKLLCAEMHTWHRISDNTRSLECLGSISLPLQEQSPLVVQPQANQLILFCFFQLGSG